MATFPVHSGGFSYSLGSVSDILRAGVPVVGLIEANAVLPVCIRIYAEIHPRLLSPKEVRGDCDETLLGQFITMLTNICVHPEQLL